MGNVSESTAAIETRVFSSVLPSGACIDRASQLDSPDLVVANPPKPRQNNPSNLRFAESSSLRQPQEKKVNPTINGVIMWTRLCLIGRRALLPIFYFTPYMTGIPLFLSSLRVFAPWWQPFVGIYLVCCFATWPFGVTPNNRPQTFESQPRASRARGQTHFMYFADYSCSVVACGISLCKGWVRVGEYLKVRGTLPHT